MTNRIGINTRSLNRLASDNNKYTVIKHHSLDRIALVFGESVTFGAAQFIADTGFLEDERNYNDCEELEGRGIGFSYLVFDPVGNLVYEKRNMELN